MIEPTDEMINAFWSGASWPKPGDLDVRRGLAAVLAVVERKLAGPCPASFHIGLLAATEPLRCNLRAGHAGDHENGVTRWWEVES